MAIELPVVPALPPAFDKAMSAATATPTATISRPLVERISDALMSSPHVPMENLRFETADGRVTLSGNVRTFFQKQMAQEALRRVDGVEQIENLLQVNWV